MILKNHMTHSYLKMTIHQAGKILDKAYTYTLYQRKLVTRCLATVIASLTLTACSSFGTDRVVPDRFDYNQAIGQSTNQQMLLNLVRLRYRDVPVFLSVSSVLSQYVYLGNANIAGAAGSASGGFGATYIDRPTISYSPLSGEEFAHQMLTPISSTSIFSLAQSGWPAGQLIMMSFERLSHLNNSAFGPVLSHEQIKQMEKFELAVKLIVELGKHNGFDSYHGEGKDAKNRYLVFEQNPAPETRKLINRFKKVLRLNPDISKFRITDRQTNLKPDEITIKLRSLLTLMGFLSHGVEVPNAHMQEKLVELNTEVSKIENNDFFVPLHIRSSEKEPDHAFVAIEYQDYWFYIEHSDHVSKQAFGLLTYLYMLQAPQAPSGVPIITIPAG
ncbi:MAG: hypothetical protein GQ583_11630 [Methyloprofundus sp.]|nr:hypothetical protein [Methyloprofundus sp.]